ncbi:MAG: pyruvate formate lyase-activating protein [Clostridiales bacterium]|jgi:pyruvate formate lyase activating enzyme|nr:pyruvate formate lyase-activating protein [Clostridiales bacterium]
MTTAIDYDPSIIGGIHSIYTGGMVDGPGIRTVLFLAGCSLRCLYCHNPDTWFRMRGNKKAVAEILDEVQKYSSYYKFSGGGITVSGGEPTDQPTFLKELLKACRANNIHSVLDTSGFSSPDIAEDILPYVDLLLLDFKAYDPDLYKKITSSTIERPLQTLRMARNLNVLTWIRYVLVPNLTDDLAQIREMSAFLKKYNNIEKVSVLPFHKHGEHKWDDTYTLKDTEPPSTELLLEVIDIFNN